MNNALKFSALTLAAILATGCNSIAQKTRETAAELNAPALHGVSIPVLQDLALTIENPKMLKLLKTAIKLREAEAHFRSMSSRKADQTADLRTSR